MTTNADTAGALMDASSRIAALVPRHADLPVPTCPGWTVERLAIHVGRIHRWVAVALDTPDDRPVPAVARPAAGTDVAAWLIDGANHLLEAFARVGPNGAVPAGWPNSSTRLRCSPIWRVVGCDAPSSTLPGSVPASSGRPPGSGRAPRCHRRSRGGRCRLDPTPTTADLTRWLAPRRRLWRECVR